MRNSGREYSVFYNIYSTRIQKIGQNRQKRKEKNIFAFALQRNNDNNDANHVDSQAIKNHVDDETDVIHENDEVVENHEDEEAVRTTWMMRLHVENHEDDDASENHEDE